ncbi:hypothetical protein [Microbacterium sp. GCS4]|uniref:hypothetical protein n=1 Tax=Microbacterium sp. GCS4 TaxID=1692239 RepID=UPI00068297A5|nr:hypothetical protein [Microbacterium sp. GCS4]
MDGRRHSLIPIIATAAVSLMIGALIRGALPPFVLDDPFWRAFWSGPPMAGLLAVVAATVAFYPAYRSTRIARENSAREQWWKRAEWALGRAASNRQIDREVANDALAALVKDATETEAQMILRTIANLQSSGAMDTRGTATDNGRRRWMPW